MLTTDAETGMRPCVHDGRCRQEPPRLCPEGVLGLPRLWDLGRGFAILVCPDCHRTRTVAHSCQSRGFCPSCLGRRMAQTAANLVDRVIPFVGVRQWVLSLPIPLRFTLARTPKLRSAVLRVFLRIIFRWYERRARAEGGPAGHTGAVVMAQGFSAPRSFPLHPQRRSVGVCRPSAPDPRWKLRWIPWAQLLFRSFGVESLRCECGAMMKVHAVVIGPPATTRALRALQGSLLGARAPPGVVAVA